MQKLLPGVGRWHSEKIVICHWLEHQVIDSEGAVIKSERGQPMLLSGKKLGETNVQLTWKADYMPNEFVVLEKRQENRMLMMCVLFSWLPLTM